MIDITSPEFLTGIFFGIISAVVILKIVKRLRK